MGRTGFKPDELRASATIEQGPVVLSVASAPNFHELGDTLVKEGNAGYVSERVNGHELYGR